ncbi:hypothetical protein [Gordonia rubripertincta]|uniref:Uncharacterized protein n=1 Tax=Gordonia rubripertincta TaxID=36822 RepID=A0ABT4MR93_GORRU|nr:hypothetical protein [Gordonia rubripertincta]MCZ4548561.1 hypothetical protein [Gordonia rubripertincta]
MPPLYPRRGARPATAGSRCTTFPATSPAPHRYALHLTGWRAANTIADDRRFDKVAATYEAVANAAEHSYPAAPEHSHQNTIMTTDLPGTAIAMHWQFDS